MSAMFSAVPDAAPSVFHERNQGTTVQNLGLSHLSVAVGHFYMDELENGEEPIRTQFERVKPWLDAAKASAISGGERPRVSTCFLVDDYFQHWPDTPQIVEKLLRLSREAGVTIDYVARESACARRLDGFQTAELVATRLLEEPFPEGANGGRPPISMSGWMSNGKPPRESRVLETMESHVWEPAHEFGERNHSIYLDVELWDSQGRPGGEDDGELGNRRYSCPFLAAVWQLIRLGLLRQDGQPALKVTDFDGEWRTEWDQCPDIVKVNPSAQPFYAYRSLSILPRTFLPIEHSVQNIINHFLPDPAVVESLDRQAGAKNVPLPPVIADRLSHFFLAGGN
ncbi:hypothetical protein KGQ20_03350 [Catenulispora sp. NF23]|nr:hypothetical protein [Catenulispora pinistramenti]